MPLYERRTYQVQVGQMPEIVRLYTEEAWPAMEAAGLARYCVGYFISDTGGLHQLMHIWRFEDDADRRSYWERLYSDAAFMSAVAKIRPLLLSQENQLLKGAPWGPAA